MNQENISRNIFIYSEITSELICDVMRQLTEVNDYDDIMDSQVKDYERVPVKLFINSGGGEVLPTIGLCEYIKHNMITPVIGICMGEVCSAAFIILIHCSYRMATKGSSLMAHPMSSRVNGSTRDCENVINHMRHIEKYLTDSLKEETELPIEIIDEMFMKQIDRYFTPEEAKEYKIIDSILGEKTEEELEEEKISFENEEESEKPCNCEDDE